MTAVDEFADVVRRYCAWLGQPQPDDIFIAHKLLAELQLRVLQLPELISDDEYVEAEIEGNPREDLIAVRQRFAGFPNRSVLAAGDASASGADYYHEHEPERLRSSFGYDQQRPSINRRQHECGAFAPHGARLEVLLLAESFGA